MANKKTLKKIKELTHEFIPTAWSHLTNMTTKELASLSFMKWTATSLKQFDSKIKLAMLSEDYQEKVSVAVEVTMDNGASINYLFVPEEHSLFSLAEDLRISWGPKLRTSKNTEFSISHIEDMPWTQEQLVDLLASLVDLSRWTQPEFKKIKSSGVVPASASYSFNADLPADVINSIMAKASHKAVAQNYARRLSSLPYSHLNSADLVNEAIKATSDIPGCEVTHYTVDMLKDLGAGAFCAVVQGTKDPQGGIVVVKRRTNKTKPIVLVGKGITFDTGGLNLKTDGGLTGMHRDMTGAAVTLGLFKELCYARPDLDLSLYLAIGENMISEKSFLPGDVVEAMNGKTIEIDDTDAEGRLVLYDTLLLAEREILSKKAVVITVATLTGSCVDVAGPRRAVVATNREKLWEVLYAVGKKSAERVVPVPIDDEFEDELKTSLIADSTQNTGHSAEHCYAAAFLASAVNEEKTFIHLDIGGTEFAADGLGLVNTAVTGFGCRFLYQLIDEELSPLTVKKLKKDHHEK
ncbi:hypothetical protein [Bdellovibrio sp. BCCA]|uniref:hypothetical protein n=1 Tax=Bdellovibrio sp. BCCA TaxID=3136281 RepID=UPI0030F08885